MKKIVIFVALCALSACTAKLPSTHVWLTSAAGDKCSEQPAVTFLEGTMDGAVVLYPEDRRQVIDGFGGSLTESSAFVLACLSPEERQAVLEELYGEKGANFTLSRTQIGASDFSVEGKYSLAEEDGDIELKSFSLDRDKEGFSRSIYPQVKDCNYDLYHLMKDVWNIKQSQADKAYRIFANTWTAPAWMKENKKYYERENGFHRGGALLPEYYQVYAEYLAKYIEAWRAEGVNIWAVTPVNEPMGNDGGWESMDFWPAVEAQFIAENLGPTFEKHGLNDVAIYGFDQNIFEMGPYTAAIYGNEAAKNYTTGMAVHWYGSTMDCFPATLDSIHALYPDKTILHTEGCIDNLGCDPWDGVMDPEGFKECCWFNNDEFWWSPVATDWAYSTRWAGKTHPAYAPVHRYARYIIEGMNHWLTGFLDWNIVLDSIGGPNHVNNFAAAQVMVDYQNDIIYYTPYYYVLKQFSRSMRPGDQVLRVKNPYLLQGEDLHVCASVNEKGEYAVNILNTGGARLLPLQIGNYYARINVPENSVMTIVVSLPAYTPAPAAKVGTVVRDTIQGTPCCVYLPDQYETRAATEVFPVLYLQHGMWGNENDWVEQGNLLHCMDSLLALRATKEMVVIMPDNCPHRATSEEEKANAMSGAWEANFPQFIAEAEQRYSISSDPAQRAIAGLSMGGFHTMHISHYLHGSFAKVGLFSPAIRAPREAEVYDHWEEEVRLQLAEKPLYWIAIGSEDFLYDNVAEYRRWLNENGLPYTYFESEGGHTWPNWQDYICRFLQMI